MAFFVCHLKATFVGEVDPQHDFVVNPRLLLKLLNTGQIYSQFFGNTLH